MKDVKKLIISLMSVAITMGVIWNAYRIVPPKEATWDDVEAEATKGGYKLIATDELFRQYKEDEDPESLLLVDTRQEWEYRTGHIKNAVNFPLEPTWLSRWRKKGALEKLLGPDKSRFIVFY